MDIIQVPATPKEAFNKQRRISDLIKAQVKHFKHLEEKLSPERRASLPTHAVVTENDAAMYIAAMTQLLCAGETAQQTSGKRQKRVVPIRPAATLQLAAVGEPIQHPKKNVKKTTKKKPQS